MRVLLIALVFGFCVQYACSQSIARQVVASAGSSNSVNNIHVNATIGQPSMVQSNSNDTFYYTQGFQHYLSIKGQRKSLDLNFSLYPNPATSFFKLAVDTITNYDVTVSDISGKKVSVRVDGDLFDISGLRAGTYFISIIYRGYHIPLTSLIVIR